MGRAVNRQTKFQRETVRVTLLDSTTVDLVGPWVLIDTIRPWSIVAEGDFDGAISLRVSNRSPSLEPAAASAQYPLVDIAMTAPTFLQYDVPVIWIRAELAGNTSGTAQVDFVGG